MSDKTQMTAQQKAAVERQGRVIVSASAGSGKTFVMIKRLTDLIISGVSLDNALAVTFTRKATAGMQEKLRSALIGAINAADDKETKRRLKEQLGKIPLADISTIHSFCSNLIRNYFYAADVSGDFTVVSTDDAVGRGLYTEAMENVIEEGYANLNEDKDFALLLKIFVRGGRDTSELEKTVSEIYHKLRVTADYNSAAEYFSDFSEERFGKIVTSLISSFSEECDEILKKAEGVLPGGKNFPLEDCVKAKEYVSAVASAFKNDALEKITSALLSIEKPRKSTKKAGVSEADLCVREEISALKEAAAECAEDFIGYKFADTEEEKRKYLSSGEVMKALYNFAVKFDGEYSRLKKEKACLDYGDLEHVALKLLYNEDIRKTVREKYKYVFVDEYQDVNPLQEEILSLIGGENIFLVGDGKQAIYGFRGGKSVYFTRKTKEYGEGALDLDRNFRSAKEILSFVNEVFRYSMTEKSSGIKYQDMTYGGRYGEAAGYVKICRCVSSEEKRDVTEVYDLKELDLSSVTPSEQTKRVYSIINNCVNSTLGEESEEGRIFSPETGKFRKAEYGDIAILSRNDDDSLKDTIAYLTKRGVPVVSLSEINVCDYPEVKMILGALEYIDNPAADIPLCTAMLSPLGRFTEDELAKIKLFSDNHGGKDIPSRSFRKDLELYEQEGEGELKIKIDDFLSAAKALRIKACTLSAGEIISLLLSVYGFETEILSRSGGLSAMARVERFSAEAGREESVHEFLDSLDKLGYSVTYTENGGENAVKALTIHKSKGLEFPIVIIIGASSAFHSPKKEAMCYDEEYGFAPRYYDVEKMIKNRTVFSRYAERKSVSDGIKDELNLFYVATTRAEYALYIVYKGRKKGKSPYLKPNSYMDFVPAETEAKYLAADEENEEELNEERIIIPSGGEEAEKAIRAAYKKEYDYKESCFAAAKSSATALLSKGDENYYAGEPLVSPIDENGGEDGRENSVNMEVNASVGTAYHKFLELADFSKSGREEYDRLKGKIPEEYYCLLSPTQCEKILSIPKLKELASARAVRERQFIVSFPANKFTGTGAADDVVYQGAIDLFAYTKNGIELVDYKYSRRSDEDIKKHYEVQLKLYRATLAKILKVAEENINVTVINILSCRAISID